MILTRRLSKEQIVAAEVQHYIRSNIGRHFRERAAREAASVSPRAHELLMETYKEECTADETGPSHVDLIRRLVLENGVSEDQLNNARSTPGNIAAIAIYKDITDRGPMHHMVGAGAVEFYYSALSPKIFEVYTEHYGP
jgi:pyrroloquinoline quinone (PQQ) biosynthesis protein C